MHRAKTYFLDIYFIRDYTGAQIAKAEPSQTQKVAKKDKIKLILCKDNEKKSRYYPFLKDEWIDGQCPKSTPVKISYDEYKLSKQTICLREKQGNDTPAYLILSKNDVSCDVGIDHTVEIKFDGEDFYLKKNKLTKQLKIAKIDPRQNQKVSKSETTVKLVFKGQYVCLEGDTNCGKYSPSGPISFNKWKSRKSSFNKNGLCMSPEFGTVFYAHTIDNCDHYEKTYSKKYYRLTNLKDNVFKIDGYIGKVAINKFDDSTGQGEGSSVVAKKVAKKIKNVVTAIICNTSKNRTEYQLWIYNTEFLSSNNCKKLNKNFSNFSYKDYTLLQKNSDILLSETYKSKRVYLTKKYNYPICFSEDRKISIGSQHCTTSILEKDTYKELEVLESDDHIIYLKIKGTKTQFAKKETEQKDEYLYNWYAIAKHPKTNFEFIATKVSNKDDAKKIAIKKCYNFVTNQLNKKGYNDCFIDLIIDKRDNLQLAEDITLKQQDQITQIAKVVPGPNKQIKKDDFKCTWKSIDKVINFSINKKKIVDYGGYKYPIIFENNKYIMFVSSNDYGGIKLFNKNTKELHLEYFWNAHLRPTTTWINNTKYENIIIIRYDKNLDSKIALLKSSFKE